MNHDPEIIRKVEGLPISEWTGIVYRHTFGALKPERENTRGARWNPPETRAIYACLARETAIAEGDYYMTLQPVRPSATRRLHKISVRLGRVIDLSSWDALKTFGINKTTFAELDFAPTQSVGGVAEWLGCDGLLVPSARCTGTNLVIFPRQAVITDFFDPVESEDIP